MANALRNPTFSRGKADPLAWVWSTTGKSARWFRQPAGSGGRVAGMHLEIAQAPADAFWSQTVACKAGEYYRVEATVSCEALADEGSGGFVVQLQPMNDERDVGESWTTPGIHRAVEPTTVRAVFLAPQGVRRVRLTAGLARAQGVAAIHEVRFIRILEPDEVAHLMALPPPGYALRDRPAAVTVCVCSTGVEGRPITRILRETLGHAKVQELSPSALAASDDARADALLLPDPEPPPSVRSLAGLFRLAAKQIVVISTPAFATLSQDRLRLRRIEQADDPIHAKVMYGDGATHGFALHDVFAYAWPGRTPGSFVQNQFRKTADSKAFLEKHGLDVLLASMCDQDSTSEHPIALFKRTEHGALFVLDIEPAEAAASTRGEPVLAVHLLLSILGRPPSGLGQFAAPVERESGFRAMIRDLADRFEHFVVHDEDVPAAEVVQQLVTIGREDRTFGLPLKPKPLILIRTGLRAGDFESIYGALLWLKQLIRMPPYVCPYAAPLTSRFRLAWVPCAAPWDGRDGWRRRGIGPAVETDLELEDGTLAALIDVVSRPINRVRAVLPGADEDYARYGYWLPRLADAFPAGHHIAYTVPDGAGFGDRTAYAWRQVRHRVEVRTDESAFHEVIHHSAARAGADLVRLEVPGGEADFTACSIQRTDLVATVLEHVVGLQHGVIAVNRQAEPARLDGFSPVGSGEALVVDRQDPILRAGASKAG